MGKLSSLQIKFYKQYVAAENKSVQYTSDNVLWLTKLSNFLYIKMFLWHLCHHKETKLTLFVILCVFLLQSTTLMNLRYSKMKICCLLHSSVCFARVEANKTFAAPV